MGDEVVENKGTGSYFLGQFAHLGLSVKHVALGTTKLVWLLKGHHHCHVHRIRHILHSKLLLLTKKYYLVMIAGEVVLAVSGVSIDGVSLQQVLGSQGVSTSRAAEPVHLQEFLGVVAHPC